MNASDYGNIRVPLTPLGWLATALLFVQPCASASFEFKETDSMDNARFEHTATLLNNGKVLVAGGSGVSGSDVMVEVYDPVSGTWDVTAKMNINKRPGHTATLLHDGKVLVAGGTRDEDRTAELYDPLSGTWTITGDLAQRRSGHTATLLPNGQVLVAGGVSVDILLKSVELYDPVTGIWSSTADLTVPHGHHSATLLPNGKVLIAGGGDNAKLCELYDPVSGTWTFTGDLGEGRQAHTATLLADGKVLVVGGSNTNNFELGSTELYDSATGTWTSTGQLIRARNTQSATLLPNSQVLIAGGQANDSVRGIVYLSSAELYDPVSGTWTRTGSLNTGRFEYCATLLPNGKVLVEGGWGRVDQAIVIQASAELFDPGAQFDLASRPQIREVQLTQENRVVLGGSRFQGVSSASTGNTSDSSTNYPVVQLRSSDRSAVTFLNVDPANGWSDTSFTSVPLQGFPSGKAFVTVFTNGIRSKPKSLVIP